MLFIFGKMCCYVGIVCGDGLGDVVEGGCVFGG